MSCGSHQRCRGLYLLSVKGMIMVHLLVSSYSPVRLRSVCVSVDYGGVVLQGGASAHLRSCI